MDATAVARPIAWGEFSVDIETTGVDPSNNAIMQIGAAAYDFATGQIGPVFCVNMSMPPKRYWDEDTRDWWRSQGQEVFDSVTCNPVHPRVGLQMFADWVNQNSSAINSPVMIAKPTSFEQPFLASYFNEFEINNPFHFRDCICLNSFIRGLRRDLRAHPKDLEREVGFIGNAHNGLDDALFQIAVMELAKQRFMPA
jgi:hypothetical protein